MKLVEFSVSHFCEKSRWALDHKGVEFERVVLVPVAHLVNIRKYGVPKTTVPILLDGDTTIQGTGAIFDHLDAKFPEGRLTPTGDLQEEARELEKYLDREVGEMLRRQLYAFLLPDKGLLVDMWSQAGPSYGRAVLSTGYPLAKRLLKRAYKVTPDGVASARVRFEKALDTLEARLAESPWLLGDEFSRIDITAAALLAPAFSPPEHPYEWPPDQRQSDAAREALDTYRRRPIADWVLNTYKTHRKPNAAS